MTAERPSESCRCGAPGPLVGLGQVPVWLCLPCFDKKMQAVGETTRALWNALGDSAPNDPGVTR